MLPAVLRDDEQQSFDEDRLADALEQLAQVSLISCQDTINSYSMCPLVHTCPSSPSLLRQTLRSGSLPTFSWVYFPNGLFDETEPLNLRIQQLVCDNLGLGHPSGRITTLFLAGTYWHQTRTDKAAQLQEGF